MSLLKAAYKFVKLAVVENNHDKLRMYEFLLVLVKLA